MSVVCTGLKNVSASLANPARVRKVTVYILVIEGKNVGFASSFVILSAHVRHCLTSALCIFFPETFAAKGMARFLSDGGIFLVLAIHSG